MKVLNLPFTKKIGIEKSEKPNYLLQLKSNNKNFNHLETIHGSASFSLAETTSGYFLSLNFADIANNTIPILRSSSIKYKKSSAGTLYSKAKLVENSIEDILLLLRFKRKALFTIAVTIYDENNTLLINAEYEWFVTMKK